MSVFDFVTIAVSFILGLAVAYLLESTVDAFRARRTCRLHWLPFTWAGFVLIHLFQFRWALYEVNEMASISVGIFSLLLFLAVLLFVAGALVLPRCFYADPMHWGCVETDQGLGFFVDDHELRTFPNNITD